MVNATLMYKATESHHFTAGDLKSDGKQLKEFIKENFSYQTSRVTVFKRNLIVLIGRARMLFLKYSPQNMDIEHVAALPKKKKRGSSRSKAPKEKQKGRKKKKSVSWDEHLLDSDEDDELDGDNAAEKPCREFVGRLDKNTDASEKNLGAAAYRNKRKRTDQAQNILQVKSRSVALPKAEQHIKSFFGMAHAMSTPHPKTPQCDFGSFTLDPIEPNPRSSNPHGEVDQFQGMRDEPQVSCLASNVDSFNRLMDAIGADRSKVRLITNKEEWIESHFGASEERATEAQPMEQATPVQNRVPSGNHQMAKSAITPAQAMKKKKRRQATHAPQLDGTTASYRQNEETGIN